TCSGPHPRPPRASRAGAGSSGRSAARTARRGSGSRPPPERRTTRSGWRGLWTERLPNLLPPLEDRRRIPPGHALDHIIGESRAPGNSPESGIRPVLRRHYVGILTVSVVA